MERCEDNWMEEGVIAGKKKRKEEVNREGGESE